MSTIATLLVRLGVDAAEVDKGMGKAHQLVEKHGAKIADAAQKIGLAAGVALGAGLANALSVEQANDKLAAQLGASGPIAADLGKTAGALYAQGYGENIGQVNDAIGSVMRNIDQAATASDADLQRISGSVLNLATTFEQDLGGVTRAVGQMLRTGLAKDANEALDVLTVGFQMGNDKAGDLLDTVNEYGTQFRKVGLSGQAMMGLITQGLQAGARDADKVADAIKEFSIRAVDGSKLSADGFRALGLDAAKMTAQIATGGPAAAAGLQTVLDRLRAIQDPAKQSQAAVALFGIHAEDLGAALLALDPSKATDMLGSVAGAADKMGATLADNAATKVEMFKRQVIGTFTELAGQAVPALQQMVDWMGRNGDIVTQVAIGLTALAAVVGAVKVAMVAYNAVMLMVRAASLVWTGVQWLLNASFWAFPLVWIIAAVIAVVAIIVLLWMKCETFRKIVLAVWAGIKTAFIAIGAAAMWLWNNGIKPAITAIGAVAMWLWHNVIQPVVAGIGAAWSWLVGAIQAGWAFWSNIFQSIANLAMWLFAQLLRPLLQTAQVAIQALGAVVAWLWNNVISPVFTAIATAATWLWNNVFVPVGKGIVATLQLAGAGFSWLWRNAIAPAVGAIGSLVNWIWRSLINPAFSAIASGVRWLGDTFRGVFSAIGGYISSAFHGAVGIVRSAINGLIGLLNSAIGFLNRNVIDNANKVPGVSFPHLPQIPYLAAGGDIRAPGAVVVGDNGPELLEMPRGARVTPLDDATGPAGAPVTVLVYLGDEQLEPHTVRTIKGNPEAVALANRAGFKKLGYTG